MKQIPMTELVEGDVFFFKNEGRTRMSYLVEKVDFDTIEITKRNGDVTQKPTSKKIEGKVWFSRNIKNASK